MAPALTSLGILLPALFASLTLLFFRRGAESRRSALLHAALVWGLVCVVLVEFLSVVHALTPLHLRLGWALACALAAVPLLLKKGVASASAEPRCGHVARWRVAGAPLLGGLFFITTAVGLTVLWAPPNTEDVQLYHLPRVLFWLQQRSVEHFPTTNYQQLFQPPFAEFAMLHLYALSGGDRFVSLVHFFSYFGCAMVASLIAQSLGAGVRGQLFAAVFTLTLPQGVLTASGAKNDYVLAFWMLAALWLTFRYADASSWPRAFYFGLASALSVCTKGTAYVLLPVMLLFAVMACGARSLGRWWKAGVAALALIAAVNSGHYLRNYRLFGSPLGCDSGRCDETYRFANREFGPKHFASNVLRNLSLHATTPFPQFGRAVYGTVLTCLRKLDLAPEDPRNTWPEAKYQPTSLFGHEAVAGNPVHLILVVACVIALSLGLRKHHSKALVYALGPLVAFLAFCWIFRWQPWHTRLHLPMFTAAAPAVGCAIERSCRRWQAALAGFLLVYAAPYAVGNALRPIVPTVGAFNENIFHLSREAMYRPAPGLPALVRALKNQPCRRLVLDSPVTYPTYPLLRFLDVGLGEFQVLPISHDGRFAPYYRGRAFRPCAVVYAGCSDSLAQAAACASLSFAQVYGDHRLVLKSPDNWPPKF